MLYLFFHLTRTLIYSTFFLVAPNRLTAPENKELFESFGVMDAKECDARAIVLHDHYFGTVEMEALTLIDMINQNIVPSVKAARVGPLGDLEATVGSIQTALAGIHAAETSYEKAQLARVLRLETMMDIQETCDAAKGIVPAELWTLAAYKELLLLDSHSIDLIE